jgi:hypothetical protein
VKDSPPQQTVLIVDPDLGLLFWLGEISTKAGCRTIPALDCFTSIPPEKERLFSYRRE